MKALAVATAWSPSILIIPAMVLSGIVVIAVILVLGYRSNRVDVIDIKLDRVMEIQEDIRTRVKANDRSIRVLESDK
jgi:hypothetical protein